MTHTTNTEVTRWVAEALIAQEGVTQSYRRFMASNGVNYTDKSYDLPDGSHLEQACLSPTTSLCRYEWRLYSPLGVIVAEHAPTPIGIYGGRYSDYMAHVLRCYKACEAAGGWKAAHLFAEVWNGGKAPTQKAIDEQIERGRRNREEAGRLHYANR